jgi:putative component of toxin-antitoxin plasmid stabilization module
MTEAFDDWFAGLSDKLAQRGAKIVILLAGGDKSTQSKDIKIALKLARQL